MNMNNNLNATYSSELLQLVGQQTFDKLTTKQKRFVYGKTLAETIERTPRRQVSILNYDAVSGISKEITISENRWNRQLFEGEEYIGDFIIVNFSQDVKSGSLINDPILRNGVSIKSIIPLCNKKALSVMSKGEAISMWKGKVCNRVYYPLFQSASQTRNVSAVFFGHNPLMSVETQWQRLIQVILGGRVAEDNIKLSMAKFLSTLGLCQSSSQACSSSVHFKVVEDFVCDNGIGIGNFNYTDGEGWGPNSLFIDVAKTLHLPLVPCALQCRISSTDANITGVDFEAISDEEFASKMKGGKIVVGKGMIFNAKDKLKDNTLVLGEKMLKLQTNSVSTGKLEICLVGHSASEYGRFTYQYIQATSITGNTLIEIANEFIAKMVGILQSPEKAMEFLGLICSDDDYDERLTSKVRRILDANPNGLFDPWVQTKLKTMMEKAYKDMGRGRIYVKGAYHFCATEPALLLDHSARMLKAGQAYLSGNTGKVSLFRSPCLHPSQPRTVELVTSPELEGWYGHLKDVIIFNSYDDIAYSGGGADNDGDKFFVCFDERITNCVSNGAPIITPSGKKAPIVDINYTNLIKHMSTHLVPSKVGQATDYATVWLDLYHNATSSIAQADFDHKVRELTKLQGPIIDSAKTDGVVNIPKYLWTDYKPSWLVGDKEVSEKTIVYTSNSPMGILYAHVTSTLEKFKASCLVDCQGLEDLATANIDKVVYDKIALPMNDIILAYKKDMATIHNKYQSMENSDATQEAMNNEISATIELYSTAVKAFHNMADPMQVTAIAYYITCVKARTSGNGINIGYSFPWMCCFDNMLVLMNNIPVDNFMLKPIRRESKSTVAIPANVDVINGTVWTEGVFIGVVNDAKNGNYDTYESGNRYFIKVANTKTFEPISDSSTTYAVQLVGLGTLGASYLEDNVDNTIMFGRKQTPNMTSVVVAILDGSLVGQVATDSLLEGVNLIGANCTIVKVLPSPSRKSATVMVTIA